MKFQFVYTHFGTEFSRDMQAKTWPEARIEARRLKKALCLIRFEIEVVCDDAETVLKGLLIDALGFMEAYHKDFRYPGAGKCSIPECCAHCCLVSNIINTIGAVPSIHEGV